MNLNDLSSAPLNDAVDFANLPAQGGGSAPPPYPGPKRFRLPKTLSPSNFTEYEVDGKKKLQVKFDDAAPLVIIQADPQHQDEVQTAFRANLNGNARERGKKGSGHFASDIDYLLAACGFVAPTADWRAKASNRDFATAILALAQKETEFAADIEWSWGCGKDRDARFAIESGGVTTVESAPGVNIKGCGAKYYQGDVEEIKKSTGAWPLTITCSGKRQDQLPCGANLRAFGNLSRIRK